MFKRVVAENFLSWAELEFEFVPGVTLIEGFNHDDQTSEGSGKSAILNALCWGLYGKIPKDTRIDDVVREGSKGCSVELVCEFGVVVRKRKPNDLYLILPDGSNLKGRDAKETQAILESFIGMSFETFLQAVYWAQNYPGKFVTATEEEKAKILSEILDLKIFDRARASTVVRLRDVEVQAAHAEKARSDIELKTMSVDRQLEDYRSLERKEQSESNQRLQRLTEEHEALIAELHEDEARLSEFNADSARAERADIQKFLEEAGDLRTELTSRILRAKQYAQWVAEGQESEARLEDLRRKWEAADPEGCKQALNDAREALNAERNRHAELNMQLGNLGQQRRLRDDLSRSQVRKQNEINNLEKEIQSLKNPAGQKCPTCGTSLQDAKRDHLAGKIRQLEEKATTLQSELAGLTAQLAEPVPDDVELRLALSKVSEKVTKLHWAEQKAMDSFHATESLRADLSVEESRWVSLQERVGQTKPESEAEVEAHLTDLEEKLEEFRRYDEELLKALTEHDYRVKEFKAKQGRLAQVEANRKREAEQPALARLRAKLSALGEEKLVLRLQAGDVAAELETIRTVWNRLQTLKDGFREIKAYVFQNILAELTRRTNQYLIELFEVPTTITFTNLSDDGEISKIQVHVTYDGSERPLGLYSGGQFRRIQLAVDLALSEIVALRAGKPMSLRILDEYFKDLSESSMDKALRLLEKLPGTTILIEHNSMFRAIVNQVFQVSLEAGVSRRAA